MEGLVKLQHDFVKKMIDQRRSMTIEEIKEKDVNDEFIFVYIIY